MMHIFQQIFEGRSYSNNYDFVPFALPSRYSYSVNVIDRRPPLHTVTDRYGPFPIVTKRYKRCMLYMRYKRYKRYRALQALQALQALHILSYKKL